MAETPKPRSMSDEEYLNHRRQLHVDIATQLHRLIKTDADILEHVRDIIAVAKDEIARRPSLFFTPTGGSAPGLGGAQGLEGAQPGGGKGGGASAGGPKPGDLNDGGGHTFTKDPKQPGDQGGKTDDGGGWLGHVEKQKDFIQNLIPLVGPLLGGGIL